MPWFIPSIGLSDAIKKRVCIYLLQRYLGDFLEEKLTVDQLSLDIYNGRGTVENVSLDVQALNALGKEQNLPMEFVSGYLQKVSFKIPWALILKDSTFVEIHGLKLTVQPKQRDECATSMFESMWSSMSNSMQLAQECMNQEASNIDDSQPLEGIEIFAQAIDSILSRVKVKFLNTTIQVEHVPKDSMTGVGITINIAVMDYSDEAGNDPPTGEATDEQEQKKAFIVSSYTAKNFYLEGITLSTIEFPSKSRTFSESSMTRSFMGDKEQEDSILTMMQESSLCEDDMDLADEVDSKADYKISDRHVILFGKFLGRQEVRMKFKQSEDVSGPKVSIDINLGAMNLFLSPRQVYVLAELANGLSSPDMEDKSNIAPKQECVQKPMTSLDYQRVEQELQLKLHPCNTFQAPGLQGIKGWSTSALDESDNDDNFLPMHPVSGNIMGESIGSNISSSMESSLSSSMASSLSEVTSNRTRRKVNNIECDPTAKISHFQIKFASLAVVLLHEDLLTLSHDTCSLVPSSVKQMQNTAEKYFNNLGAVILTGYGKRNFDECRANFEKACMLNHLRLMAAPIQIECDETTTSTAFSLSGKLTAAKLEVLECLKQQDVNVMDYVRILSFAEDSSSNPVYTKPCLKMNFKHVEKTVKSGMVRRTFVPKTDIMITLDVCTVEVDITLIDRICALLNSPPVCIIQKSQTNVWGNPMSSPTETQMKTESQLDIKIASNNLTVKLRFPIPDFRPAHDRQRPPWWKRSVRNSFVTLKMESFTGQTGFQAHQICQKYIIQAKSVDIFYFEKENSVPLHIAKAGVDEKYSLQEGFNWPRFVVSVYPVAKIDIELDDINEPEVDVMNQSCYGSLFQTTCKGPFSAKKVVHESDTPHSKTHQDDSDELVIPGDKQEISDFIEQTTRSARIQLDFSIPTVSMQLISKHIYEVLYNHISSDLLLWEPSAPTIKYPPNQENLYTMPNLDIPETFAMCKSGILYDSGSDSSDDLETDSRSVYFSVYEKRNKFMQKRQQQSTEPKGQSYLTMNLHIGQGVVCMNPPVRDLATNVIPEQHGEFVLEVEDVNVFSVTGYKGDDNLGYVCVQAKGAQLHHCDMITSSNVCPPLREVGSGKMPRRLHPTIYKSETGMLGNAKDRGGDREMLSVAVRIQANHETHHVKTVRVALGINKATLRHRMCSEPNSWITQLIDFFNVADYTIPGYNAKDVLTELHLHLWDCAIDYRPFYLPLRSVVTLGTFSMSSHLSATANTSTLRFIAEECGLFLSEKAPPRNGTPSSAPVDLKRDYVSVVDLGLFELSLRTNDKVSGINPHIDLRASNNILNIRTCSDSGRALTQLITYFACDGDLLPAEAPSTPTSNFSSPRHNPEEELISVEPQHISNLSKSQHQHVNKMIGEAMEESLSVQEGEVEFQSGGAKMFFFPDEGQLLQDLKPLPQVQTDLGDITFRSNKSSDTDEEFCIIGEEAGLGILPKNGLPEIRWLTEDPLRIIDNHFNIPFGKTDMLKPPKHFPVPTMRYTLFDMTVIWKMYGGNDFKSDDDKKEKKTVNFSDTHLQENVAFSNVHTGEVIFNNFMEKKKPKKNWIEQGGVNRDHTVLIELQLNKVRFQHEVYPENTTQASRQVLLVNEFEVRDRLESSQFNKFLYQHTSQARPKQSHANMIAIKALHIRPDLKLKAQECCLRISILPLRLNIDQDSLLFLINFFNELSGTTVKTDESTNLSSKHSTPTHQPPVMTISVQNEQELVEKAQKMVDDNLMLLLDDVKSRKKEEDKASNVSTETSDSSVPIYFRKVVFSPDVLIRLDYHGKRLDLTHGPLAGLIMGLGQLNSSELTLRRLSNNHGILGFDKLLTYCLQEWINDIKKNQLPSLLGGIGPMHSLVQFVQGIRDLFWLPIEQYQKDGRIVRGLQRGANSFTTSTAMAALEITSRFIHFIQITAETAYDMMSPGPSVRRAIKAKGRKRRYNQPQDIREGVANAFSVVREGIGETAENIVRVASHEREQKGYSGAIGGVLRQIPPTFVKPIIIATEATNNVLGGVQNQLLPDARKEASEKWKNNEG